MKDWRMGLSLCGFMCAAMLGGCAGKGDVRQVNLQIKQSQVQTTNTEPLKIVIEPFEDRRADKSRVGIRTHIWGGATYFNVAGERIGDVIAQRLADQLKVRGWRERPWNVRAAPASAVPDADIVISGQVQEFSTHAKSRIFSTVIDTSSRFTIQARNLVDQSTTTRTTEGGRNRTVFWFNEEDVQEQLTLTLKDGIDRLIGDTTIEQKALRPVR